MADHLTGLGTVTEILRIVPNWGEEINASWLLSRKIHEFPGTVQEFLVHSEERPALFQIGFTAKNKADEFALLTFIHGKLGRLKKFWFPSPVEFFNIADNQNLGDQFVTITDNGFLDSFRGYERIYIEKSNGDFLTYQVTNVVDLGNGKLKFDLGVALDANLVITEIEAASFLYLSRFDKDEFDLNYENSEFATMSTSVTELVKEYPA